MANTKRKARGLKWFNALFSRACFLERLIRNIIEHHGIYFRETMYQSKKLRSREATHDKARDALYDKINISVEAMMPNITVKKKKSTRGEASTTKYQEGRQMEKREKLIKKLALWGYGKKMCTGCNWRYFTKYQKCK